MSGGAVSSLEVDMNWPVICNENQKLFQENHIEFQAIFDVPLQKFWDTMFGFDVIAFDTWLLVPGGKSTRQEVRRRFGKRAVDLCLILLKQSLIKQRRKKT